MLRDNEAIIDHLRIEQVTSDNGLTLTLSTLSSSLRVRMTQSSSRNLSRHSALRPRIYTELHGQILPRVIRVITKHLLQIFLLILK